MLYLLTGNISDCKVFHILELPPSQIRQPLKFKVGVDDS